MTAQAEVYQAGTIEQLRLDRDAWRDAALRSDVIIQRFALERERLLDGHADVLHKLDEALTLVLAGEASDAVTQRLSELPGLVRRFPSYEMSVSI